MTKFGPNFKISHSSHHIWTISFGMTTFQTLHKMILEDPQKLSNRDMVTLKGHSHDLLFPVLFEHLENGLLKSLKQIYYLICLLSLIMPI